MAVAVNGALLERNGVVEERTEISPTTKIPVRDVSSVHEKNGMLKQVF